MSGGKGTVKRRVWVGLIAGIMGIGAWAWWFQAQQRSYPAGPARERAPFVQLAGASTANASRVLEERARLLDPTPLFFPTEHNYGQRPLAEGRLQQPGQFFGSYDPKLTVPEQNLKAYGLEVTQASEKLPDVLSQGNEAPFAGMGQVDIPTSTLPVRQGCLEVRQLGKSENVIYQTLDGINIPRSDYAPLEFLVIVRSDGLIGEPILTSGSGWDEVDSFFRTYLAKSYHLGERLPPGRYRVIVGA